MNNMSIPLYDHAYYTGTGFVSTNGVGPAKTFEEVKRYYEHSKLTGQEYSNWLAPHFVFQRQLNEKGEYSIRLISKENAIPVWKFLNLIPPTNENATLQGSSVLIRRI